MTELWFGITLLTIIAVMFVFLPYLRAKKLTQLAETENRESQNIEIFKERLSELEAEKSAGTLDETEFLTLKTELERNLLIDVEQNRAEQKQYKLTTQTFITVILLAAIIPASAVGLYSVLGRANDLEAALNAPADPFNGQEPTLEQAIAQLELELQTEPNNPEGWFILGTTYLNQGRFQEAANSFERVLSILPEDSPQYAGVIGQYAQALFFLNNNQITADVKTQIDRALAINPKEITSLGLLGVSAFDTEDFTAAIEYWSQALEVADPQSADSFRAGIRSAQERLAELGQAVPEVAGLELQDIALNIQVQLAPELLSSVTPSNDVFVFAREVGGRVPLAAVKLKVADLPADIVLDDTRAMNPQIPLSSATTVEVFARISKSGAPQAQAGDIYANLSPINLKEQSAPLILLMDKVVE